MTLQLYKSKMTNLLSEQSLKNDEISKYLHNFRNQIKAWNSFIIYTAIPVAK